MTSEWPTPPRKIVEPSVPVYTVQVQGRSCGWAAMKSSISRTSRGKSSARSRAGAASSAAMARPNIGSAGEVRTPDWRGSFGLTFGSPIHEDGTRSGIEDEPARNVYNAHLFKRGIYEKDNHEEAVPVP